MGAMKTQLSDKQLLWQAYRDAYQQYKNAAARLAKLNARASNNSAELETALLSLEQARLNYNDSRDTLAAYLMPREIRQAFWSIPSPGRDRVKGLAELFWLLAGRPQGTAEDDWYRAERVVRHAGAVA